MARKMNNTVAQEQPVQTVQEALENEKSRPLNGVIFTILAFITALVVMVTVVGGAAYLVIHNNVKGLGEQSRKYLQDNPALKWMLPAVPDPEDPKYMSDDEIKKKYLEVKAVRDNLMNQLDQANTKIQELQKYKDNEDKLHAEIDLGKKNLQSQQTQIDEEKKKLGEDKAKFEKLIASSDKTGFKEFYEKLDKETAQKIYSDIMKEQKASDDAKKFSLLYEAMDPDSSAKIFEQMGSEKMDLIVDILKNIKKETTAEILAAMTPTFASKVTEKMSQIYLPPKK